MDTSKTQEPQEPSDSESESISGALSRLQTLEVLHNEIGRLIAKEKEWLEKRNKKHRVKEIQADYKLARSKSNPCYPKSHNSCDKRSEIAKSVPKASIQNLKRQNSTSKELVKKSRKSLTGNTKNEKSKFSFHQKFQIARKVKNLSDYKLTGAVEILRQEIKSNPDCFEVDFNRLSDSTLRQLNEYVE